MKDAYYFPHDFNAHNDPKLIKLAMESWELVGLYWAVVEMLHEQGGWMDTNPEPIAFALRTHSERIATLINFPHLFRVIEKRFTCERVLSNLKNRKTKSDKARKSAQVLWNNKDTKTANAKRTHSERIANAMLERKGKERKGKESIYGPTVQQVIQHLNQVTGFNYSSAGGNAELLEARLQEGHTVEQVIAVIDSKVAAWINDEKMKPFLRPATLFGKTKFSQYLGQVVNLAEDDKRTYYRP